MTTLVRIQHLDSAFKVEVRVKSTHDNSVQGSPIPLDGKGDETTVYVHSGQFIEVRELPPSS